MAPVRLLFAMILSIAAQSGVGAESWTDETTGMSFVAVPKGCFLMGVPKGSFAEEDPALLARIVANEMPQHEVCLDGFLIGRFEVIEAEWARVFEQPNGRESNRPVVGVTWEQAVDFAERLTRLSKQKARFRLPTEAEWEYACRAGLPAVTRTPSRSELDGRAWYSSRYDFESAADRLTTVQPVGGRQPNDYGLHDMLGNAWEWVEDSYRADAYGKHRLFNPVIRDDSPARVLRGGGVRTDQRFVRCEARAWLDRRAVHDTAGFRLVVELKGKK